MGITSFYMCSTHFKRCFFFHPPGQTAHRAQVVQGLGSRRLAQRPGRTAQRPRRGKDVLNNQMGFPWNKPSIGEGYVVCIYIYTYIYIYLGSWYDLPSGKSNSLLLKMVIYSGFTHHKWWCSIVMLVYQMVHIWVNLITTSLRPHHRWWLISEIIPTWPQDSG